MSEPYYADEDPGESIHVERRETLWWHLLDDHGLGLGMIHGSPEPMHAALHAGISRTPPDHDHGDAA